jgi:hypothetical protein
MQLCFQYAQTDCSSMLMNTEQVPHDQGDVWTLQMTFLSVSHQHPGCGHSTFLSSSATGCGPLPFLTGSHQPKAVPEAFPH